MDRTGIVEELARQRVVETIVCRIAHRDLNQDLRDLVQMVYLILLETDESKLTDLYENGQVNNFIVRIILNQYHSTKSRFYYEVRRFADRSEEFGDRDFAEG